MAQAVRRIGGRGGLRGLFHLIHHDGKLVGEKRTIKSVLVLEIQINRADRILGFRRDLFNGGGVKAMNGKNSFGGSQNVLRPPRLLALATPACSLHRK